MQLFWRRLADNLNEGAKSFNQILGSVRGSATAVQHERAKLMAGFVSEEMKRQILSSGYTPPGYEVTLPKSCAGTITQLVRRRFARRLWLVDDGRTAHSFTLRTAHRSGAFRPLGGIAITE